ncbi:uncharacterized protein LOC126199676 [Schistocerca nitens]|uniref:uncharacterized protein LOC126199676 n=1 Tax=Schistocerca nitens TaxID=7011 RepID=UPI002118FD74|nr:uncharacterized protein LOC126199676 [Schistocerca nitens]
MARNGIQFGTWNVKSLYKTGAAISVVKEIQRYELDLVALQEIRWDDAGSIDVENCTILYGACVRGHLLGTGFCVSKTFATNVSEFVSVNPRISVLTLEVKHIKTTSVNCHAPTEESECEVKDEFYAQLEAVMDAIPNGHLRILLGDMNAKCKGRTGPKLKRVERYHVEKLKDEATKTRYQLQLSNRFEALSEVDANQDLELMWGNIQSSVRDTAKETLMGNPVGKKIWFGKECADALERRKEARNKWLKGTNLAQAKAQFEEVRKTTQAILRRAKRKYIRNIITEAETDFRGQKTREMFLRVKYLCKGHQAKQKFVKDSRDKILTNDRDIAERWKEYFRQLLNCDEPELQFDFQ